MVLNCRRHCWSDLYIAPGGRSGYVNSSSVGGSSRHLPRPWLKFGDFSFEQSTKSASECNLLEKMGDVASTAVRPRHLNGVRLKAWRHHMNDRTSASIAARFLRVVIHAKAEWTTETNPINDESCEAEQMRVTHLCPSSWVIVCASVMPLSSFTLHDRSGRHIPPTFATPSVLFYGNCSE